VAFKTSKNSQVCHNRFASIIVIIVIGKRNKNTCMVQYITVNAEWTGLQEKFKLYITAQ